MDIVQGLLLGFCLSRLLISVHSTADITGISSCNETSPGVYLNPGDTVSVMLNCSVTNNPSAPFNFLIWNVPTCGASQFLLSSVFRNASNSIFSVTLTSVDDTAGTISSQLTFIINETLDEMKVTCSDSEYPPNKDTCTILVLTLPSIPLDLTSNPITYESCVLDWDIPVDDGGEITQYSITGTPDDISNITEDTMITITNLSPNTDYTFYVSATNSLGLGETASVQCITPGNVPPGFIDVSVCLDLNMMFDTILDIEYIPCPIVITDTDNTPPVDNYTVNIMGLLSVDVPIDTCVYNTSVNEDNTYTVEMSVNNIIGSTKTTADPFITSWLRDIEVMYVTDTSVVIQYTTADCVIPDSLSIELNIDVFYFNINPSSVVSYESSTTDQFTVLGLEPNLVLTFTLQVIDMFLNIGMSHTGIFTVTSTATTTMSSSTTSTSSSTTRSISSVSTTVTSTPSDINTKCSGLSAPLSAGITAVVTIPVSSIISSLLTLLIVYLCCGKSKGNYSIDTAGPVYDTPFLVSNVTRTSEFEMKGNQAYGHVTSAISEYETVTS